MSLHCFATGNKNSDGSSPKNMSPRHAKPKPLSAYDFYNIKALIF